MQLVTTASRMGVHHWMGSSDRSWNTKVLCPPRGSHWRQPTRPTIATIAGFVIHIKYKIYAPLSPSPLEVSSQLPLQLYCICVLTCASGCSNFALTYVSMSSSLSTPPPPPPPLPPPPLSTTTATMTTTTTGPPGPSPSGCAAISPANRTDCGFTKTATECAAAGCCYDDTNPLSYRCFNNDVCAAIDPAKRVDCGYQLSQQQCVAKGYVSVHNVLDYIYIYIFFFKYHDSMS